MWRYKTMTSQRQGALYLADVIRPYETDEGGYFFLRLAAHSPSTKKCPAYAHVFNPYNCVAAIAKSIPKSYRRPRTMEVLLTIASALAASRTFGASLSRFSRHILTDGPAILTVPTGSEFGVERIAAAMALVPSS